MQQSEKISIKSKQLILNVSDVSKTFDTKAFTVHALRDVSFSVGAGEFIGLLGPSGSGKTTLINILSGLIRPTQGDVTVGDEELTAMKSDDLREFRLHNIGLVFQEHLLVESLTAIENVELPMTFARVDPESRRKKALKLLKQFGLETKMHQLPSELSGGEQQRVGIARALLFDPLLILADEPTGDLDTKTGNNIIKIFKEIAHTNGSSVIMVSHDPRHRPHFDRVLQMKDGSVEI